MITWLQVTFQKHLKWLFIVLLAVIIVTFVLTIGPQSFFTGGSGGGRSEIRFFDYDLAQPGRMEFAEADAQMSAFLNPEFNVGRSREDLYEYALARLTALHLANEWLVPAPSNKLLEEHIQQMPIFQRGGSFDKVLYENYTEAAFLQARGPRTLRRIFEEDYRIHQVLKVLAGPGYIHPFETALQAQRMQTRWSIDLVEFAYADFQPEISINEEEIAAYYEANPAEFTEPEKLRASALIFPLESFTGDVPPPSESALQSYFSRNQSRYEKPEDPEADETETSAEEEPVTLDDVREQVVSDWTEERAGRLAQEAAADFALALFNGEVARDDPRFSELLAEHKGRLEPIEPVARDANAGRFGLRPEVFAQAWSLPPQRYTTDAVSIPSGGALLVREEIIPEHLPPLEKVRDAARAAVREEKRREQFQERGEELRQQLQELASAEADFVAAVESIEGAAVSSFVSFMGSEPPRQLPRGVFEQARLLAPGEVTPMIFLGDAGAFAHIASREVPKPDTWSAQATRLRRQFEEQIATVTGMGALIEIMEKERRRAGLVVDTPEEA